MTIGEKIKQLRTEKGFSQEYIYSNQSLVSQIEKGVNKNPSDSTLKLMAEKLEVTFDELIEGTDWEPKRETTFEAEYAISRTEVNVRIADSGEIIVKRKYYNAKDRNGKARMFDPDNGIELMTKCPKCEGTIQRPEQLFCFGCGEKLFYNMNEYFLEDRYFTWDVFGEKGQISSAEANHPLRTDYIVKESHIADNLISNIETLIKVKRFVTRELETLAVFKTNVGPGFFGNEGEFKMFISRIHNHLYEFLSETEGVNYQGVIIDLTIEDNFDYPSPAYKHNWKKDKWDELSNEEVEELHKNNAVFITPDNFKTFKHAKEEHWFWEFWVEMMAKYSYHKGLLNELKNHELSLMKDMDKELDSPNPNEEKNNEEG
jgi:transcriptional regulator with XRE-family HTH domain